MRTLEIPEEIGPFSGTFSWLDGDPAVNFGTTRQGLDIIGRGIPRYALQCYRNR